VTTNKKTRAATPVPAAGAVLWRPDGSSADSLIAVIHRARYDDWSLPKGKVDPGETEPVAAVREIFEETGQRSSLGRSLGSVGDFSAGDEVDQLVWLTPKEAAKRLSYPTDRKVLARFAKKPADTATVLIVRHGAAGRRARYKGDDRMRPLDAKGRAQAESLVPQLLAFGATSVHAADRVRCAQTVEPLAGDLDVPIRLESTLTEEAYSTDPDRAHRRVLAIAAAGGTPVICTQGKVIPPLIEWWCKRDGVKPAKSRNRKGSTWVLSLAGGKVIAADHLPSPLAAQR